MNVRPQSQNFRTLALACLVIGLIAMSPAAVRADFLTDFVGNSQFANSAAVSESVASSDGIVNFAVYETIDTDWTDDFGSSIGSAISLLSNGGTAVDANTTTVFFFQVVNTNPSLETIDATLHQFKVPIQSSAGFTSIGYVDGFVFQETEASTAVPVGPVGNARLGTLADETALSDDTAGDATPSESGDFLATVPFVANSGAKNPFFGSLDDQATPIPFATVYFELFGETDTTPGDYSSVFFMTLDSTDYSYGVGSLKNGTYPTVADVPVPLPGLSPGPEVPEPAATTSLAMLLFSALGVYGFARRHGLTELLSN